MNCYKKKENECIRHSNGLYFKLFYWPSFYTLCLKKQANRIRATVLYGIKQSNILLIYLLVHKKQQLHIVLVTLKQGIQKVQIQTLEYNINSFPFFKHLPSSSRDFYFYCYLAMHNTSYQNFKTNGI